MKGKILALSLASLLFVACQNKEEPKEAFNSLQKTDSMEVGYMVVTNATAAKIHINAPRYNCKIVDDEYRVLIFVKGTKEDLNALFDYVTESTK